MSYLPYQFAWCGMYTKILIICDLFASAANPLGIKIGIYISIQLANSWTNPGIKQKSELKKKSNLGHWATVIMFGITQVKLWFSKKKIPSNY